ncbi:hypothetical protein OAL55_03235 [Verrucomicrobiales bacterium]|nr:hypothetical protein [Verrucomicrobiales bacterium]
MDHRTAKDALIKAGITPEIIGRTHAYDYIKSLQVLFQRKIGNQNNPADRRNNAQAEKLKYETLMMKRENIPINEFLDLIRPILTRIAKHVEQSAMEDELKESLVKIILKDFPDLSQAKV